MTPQAKSEFFPKLVDGYWGQILTPKSGIVEPYFKSWCGDSGAFTKKLNWDVYEKWLVDMEPYKGSCIFVTVPDVLSDAKETLVYFDKYYKTIKKMDYKIALVAQDGMESLTWPDHRKYDALFIGGSTEWKMGDGAAWCIKKAKSYNKWTHAGRVNSQKRIRHFQKLGVNSCDGTAVIYEPTRAYRLLEAELVKYPKEDLNAYTGRNSKQN